uniref:Uncharacterized protein n=1 Tax=Ditylenchus dipsaci TaxID=166011 RepID=A0A915EMI4_9BILA
MRFGPGGQEEASANSNESAFTKLYQLIFVSSTDTSWPVHPKFILISLISLIFALLLLSLLLYKYYRAKRPLHPPVNHLSTNRSCSCLSRLAHCVCCCCCCWRKPYFYTTKHLSLTGGPGGKQEPTLGSANLDSLATNRFRTFQRKIIELPIKVENCHRLGSVCHHVAVRTEHLQVVMSNVSSMAPTWLDKRWSINTTTPQSPGSPCSLSSAFKEPLLRTGSDNSEKYPSQQRNHRHVNGFWHRLSSTSSQNTTGYRSSITGSYCSSSNHENYFTTTTGPVTPASANGTLSPRQNQFLFPLGMDKLGDGNQLEDDREIDNGQFYTMNSASTRRLVVLFPWLTHLPSQI